MGLLVEGNISFESSTPAFKGATLYARLEKVSYLDAPSETIAEYVKRDVAYDPHQKNILTFMLTGKEQDARDKYAVRVHIDLDGDGEVSRGDYISMQSYPVVASDHPQKVSILAKIVK